jgi:hypothetical protein
MFRVSGHRKMMQTPPKKPPIMKTRKYFQPIFLCPPLEKAVSYGRYETHASAVGADWSQMMFMRASMAEPRQTPFARRWVGNISLRYVN